MGTTTEKEPKVHTDNDADFGKSLILHNDEHNDFDFVVDTLIVCCEHTFEQAYQCAFIAHFKGKCEIKKGSLEELRPIKQAISDRGINVTID